MMETADYTFSETHPSLLSLPSSGTKLTLFAHSPWMPHSIHTQHCEEHYQQIGKSRVQDTCTQKESSETTHFSRRARSTSAVRLHIPGYREKCSAGHNTSVTNTTRILFSVLLVLLTNNTFILFYIYLAHQ